MSKFKSVKKIRFKIKHLIFIFIIVGLYLLYIFVLKNIKLDKNEQIVDKLLSHYNTHLIYKQESIIENMLLDFINNPIRILENNLIKGEINEK